MGSQFSLNSCRSGVVSKADVGYYKVGENKNKPRIWLQGGNLLRADFTKGSFYELSYLIDLQEIVLRLVDTQTDSSRVVSGRKKNNGDYEPIIDLSSFDLLDVTQGAQRVRADFVLGEIRISIHHQDTKQVAREQRFVDHLVVGGLTEGVLCCGIGVSTAASHDGLADRGVLARTEFIVDRERKYLDVAIQNNHAVTPDTRIFEASLEELEPELLGFVDVLNFSLPCTGMGASGKTKNNIQFAEQHPTDATAILGLIRVIDACQPSILVSENVVGAMNSATYILLKGMLGVCGYHVNEVVLDSSQTGSMENRKRYWFVATSKGLPVVDLTRFPEFPKEYDVLGDLLEPVPADSAMWKSTEAKVNKAAKNKAEGKNFGFNLVDASVTTIGVCGKGYQKDRGSEPHIAGVNDTMRLLTPVELCKAQSVPLHLIENTVAGVAYEGLGQGIDYRQCRGIFQRIAEDVCYPLVNSLRVQLSSLGGRKQLALF